MRFLENAGPNGGFSEGVKLWVSGKCGFGGGQTLDVWKMRFLENAVSEGVKLWVSGKCGFGCLENAVANYQHN
jgi:hypothetical protein